MIMRNVNGALLRSASGALCSTCCETLADYDGPYIVFDGQVIPLGVSAAFYGYWWSWAYDGANSGFLYYILRRADELGGAGPVDGYRRTWTSGPHYGDFSCWDGEGAEIGGYDVSYRTGPLTLNLTAGTASEVPE